MRRLRIGLNVKIKVLDIYGFVAIIERDGSVWVEGKDGISYHCRIEEVELLDSRKSIRKFLRSEANILRQLAAEYNCQCRDLGLRLDAEADKLMDEAGKV